MQTKLYMVEAFQRRDGRLYRAEREVSASGVRAARIGLSLARRRVGVVVYSLPVNAYEEPMGEPDVLERYGVVPAP